ncbi:MAG TPA: hypothetical protein VKC99_09150, partial [Methyloceanibacter sp.]|nr:hypothetical protein [Methyloceanibacter sp.]
DQPYTRGERSRLAVTFLSGVAKKLQATKADAEIAHVLTMDEARRIAKGVRLRYQHQAAVDLRGTGQSQPPTPMTCLI